MNDEKQKEFWRRFSEHRDVFLLAVKQDAFELGIKLPNKLLPKSFGVLWKKLLEEIAPVGGMRKIWRKIRWW